MEYSEIWSLGVSSGAQGVTDISNTFTFIRPGWVSHSTLRFIFWNDAGSSSSPYMAWKLWIDFRTVLLWAKFGLQNWSRKFSILKLSISTHPLSLSGSVKSSPTPKSPSKFSISKFQLGFMGTASQFSVYTFFHACTLLSIHFFVGSKSGSVVSQLTSLSCLPSKTLRTLNLNS
jgi:hypothetical protein